MSKLFTLSTRLSIGGRVASAQFSNRFLFEASDDFSAQQRYVLALTFANVLTPLLVSSVELYTVTISPVSAPGTRAPDRTKHMTRYFGDKGARALPAGTSVGPLTICAHFVKYSTEGNAGEILIRGCIDETEVDTDADGLLVKPSGADLVRFDTFAGAIKTAFDSTGARGLVMPGQKQLLNGEFNSLAGYIAGCREVEKVEFDSLTFRQTTKQNRSIESRRRELLRAEIRVLARTYNDAKTNSPGGVLTAGDTQALMALGRAIFSNYTQSERNRVKAPSFLRPYIVA